MTDANRHPVAPWSTRVREAKRRGAARATDDVRAIDEAGRSELLTLRDRLEADYHAARERQAEKHQRRGHRARVGAWLSGFALALGLFAATSTRESAPLAAGPVTTVAHDATYAAMVHTSATAVAAVAPAPEASAEQPPADTLEATPAPTTSTPPRWTPTPPDRTPVAPSPAAVSCDESIGDPCCAFGQIMC